MNAEEKLRTVFVIHGRNEALRKALFAFLRAIGLRPLEWSQAVALTGKAAPFIGEILSSAFANAQAVVALLSGDDEARLRPALQGDNEPAFETQLTPQCRPNVLFEAGMALASHPNNTVLVEVGTIRPFSDVAGRHAIRLNNTSETRQELAARLRIAGCPVDLSGTDWHSVGDLTDSSASAPNASPTMPPAQVQDSELPNDQVAVLRFLALVENNHPNPRVRPNYVAQELGIERVLAKHLLGELVNQRMIEHDYELVGDAHYYKLAAKGRRYLVNRSLL